jgi:Tfp pilus assembly protein PilV
MGKHQLPCAHIQPVANTAGFSTIEVLVAVLICGMVFVTLYSGISSGFGFVQLARENLRATQILEEKMETIRLYRWDQINKPGFIPTNFTDCFYPVGSQTQSGVTYTGQVTIAAAPVSEFYSDGLKQVTVNLRWKSGNVVRSRQMTTLVAQYGLQNYIYSR